MHGRTEAEDTLCLKEDEIQKRTKYRRGQNAEENRTLCLKQNCIKAQTVEENVHLRGMTVYKKRCKNVFYLKNKTN